jgi:hypothetical protein
LAVFAIRIAITAEAYEAIALTLPFGSVGYETERSETGKVFIWIERAGDEPPDRRAPSRRGPQRHPSSGWRRWSGEPPASPWCPRSAISIGAH